MTLIAKGVQFLVALVNNAMLDTTYGGLDVTNARFLIVQIVHKMNIGVRDVLLGTIYGGKVIVYLMISELSDIFMNF